MFLEGKGQNGSYLVRNSTHSPGNLVLSVRADHGEERVVYHFVVLSRKGKYDIPGGPAFSSVRKLIEYYKASGNLVDNESGRAAELKFPYIKQDCS